MLHLARSAAVSRIAAMLVAVTVSGAPRVLAMSAPAERHQCSCHAHRAGDHACDCALCRRSGISTAPDDRQVPTCHRSAVPKVAQGARPVGGRETPCVEGTCGGAGRPAPEVLGAAPFCLPDGGTLVVALEPESRPMRARRLLARALEPETPPPRAA
jgi:hypothetical protein